MAQKIKKPICKYVFKLNFAPNTGSDFFILFLKLKIVGPYWTDTLVLYICFLQLSLPLHTCTLKNPRCEG
jgi:hypothetical protein